MAGRIAVALRESGYSVWFDEELPAHRTYADVIASELDAARAVLVLWSDAAAQSQWVRSEANRAREKGNLVQARTDAARLPMPFDQIQCATLDAGSLDGSAWRSITTAIETLIRGEPVGRASPVASPAMSAAEPSVAVLALRELGGGAGDISAKAFLRRSSPPSPASRACVSFRQAPHRAISMAAMRLVP
jgi:hypothetical protein